MKIDNKKENTERRFSTRAHIICKRGAAAAAANAMRLGLGFLSGGARDALGIGQKSQRDPANNE
jgi:hypothetical protein